MVGITATKKVTIAESGTKSEAIDTRAHSLTGVELPAALTSTAMTFEASHDPEGTFVAVNDDAGNAVSLVVAASKVVTPASEDRDALYGLPFLKIVMGTAEDADREIVLYLTSNY